MNAHIAFSEYAARLRDFIRRHSGHEAPASSDAEFNQLARSLFALQFEHNTDYRIFCEARDASPETIAHWSEIPAIPTPAFKEFELTSLPPAQRLHVFHSSGTTEHRPAHHFHDAESLSLYEASLLPWFRQHLLPSQRKVRAHDSSQTGGLGPWTLDFGPTTFLSLTPPPDLAPHSSLVHMFATIHREFGTPKSRFTGLLDRAGSWDVNLTEALIRLRGVVASGEPVTVMGTAFNFVQLLDHLEQGTSQIKLPARSRVLETGGYKGRTRSLPKAELHALISAKLGIPAESIVSEYGMCELSSQAYDLKLETSAASHSQATAGNLKSSARAFHFPPWARVQIISPETGLEAGEGETGLIRIFDLVNLRSVLAIQTEDLGVRRGDDFELLGRAALAEARGCSLMSL